MQSYTTYLLIKLSLSTLDKVSSSLFTAKARPESYVQSVDEMNDF